MAKKVKAKVVAVPVTGEDKKRWAGAIRSTWNTIGGDLEQAIGRREASKMKSLDILDIVLDAGYCVMYGGIDDKDYRRLCDYSFTKEGKAWLKNEFNFGF